jgi:ABC-type Fe3+-hydroxamate transport system substrate-binding protein
MKSQSLRTINDMMGRTFSVSENPQRIISVVPSQTELLYDLGLDEEVVGITKFCIHPDDWFETKTRVGGTKNLNIKSIIDLKPDLVIANKEENTQSELEELAQHVPVWISDIRNLDDALSMILQLGEILGREEEATKITSKINHNFEILEPIQNPKKAVYLIWREPYMAVNSDTFIHDMLRRCGLINLSADSADRYPTLSPEQLFELNPDLVLLSSEPFPFAEKHAEELCRLLPKARIGLVDGEAFSWYGSRLIQSAPYFKQLIRFWNR